MAISKIKTTYALDAETVGLLDRMAQRWGTSKSDALRRAIRAAAETVGEAAGGNLGALDRLQRAAAISVTETHAWGRRVRAERRAAAARRETGLP